MENNRWDEFRVEFSISAVKTKSLWTKVAPKSWSHQCLTYEQNIGTVTMFSQGQLKNLVLVHALDSIIIAELAG